MAENESKPVTRLEDIPGWFPWLDQRVFEHYLEHESHLPGGDLVELGVYMGRSAAFMGRYVGPEETFTVCDLFGNDSDDEANQRENDKSYKTLNRAKFESNYLALHNQLPVVVEDLSSAITDHVAPGSARFVHVDASHLYEHVKVDLESAKSMLKPGGVVSFDDYRSMHTPGVSAVVWGAVATGELQAICVTTQKLYGSFDNAAEHREEMLAWVERTDGVHAAAERIAGATMYRLWNDPPRKTAPPDANVLLARIDKRLATFDGRMATVDERLGTVEKAVRRIPRPEPDFATKVVRKVRGARKR